MTSQLPEGITLVELQKLAKLTAQIARIQERQKALLEKAKPLFKPGTYAYEGVVVVVTAKTELDEDAFKTAYPFEKAPEYYKISPDTKAITPVFGKQFRAPATPSMSAKVVS